MKRRGPFGELLRRWRRAAGLSQAALAARAGLSAVEIGMLERGQRRRPRGDTVNRLVRTLRLDAEAAEALRSAADVDRQESSVSLPVDVLPPHAPLPDGSHMRLARNPLFVGRTDELLRMAAALCDGDAIGLGKVVAATGLGGLGKTQLAVEFVHRYGRFFAGGVFWLSFAGPDEIPLQIAACAGPGCLGLATDAEGLSLQDRLELVRSAWHSPVPRLLVFDNCEEEALLQAWRPSSGGSRVLVTSRRSHWSPALGVTSMALGPLRRPDSIELLRRHRPDQDPGRPELDAVAHELGDLPLALHLAGSYLHAYREEVGLDGYLAELRQPAALGHASLLGAGLHDSPSPTDHVQSLAQTFALCVDHLDRGREVDRVAVALLARMACLAPGEPVPRDLLSRMAEEVSPLLRADALRRLSAVGLVEEGDGWLRLHRLIVHFVRQEGLHTEAWPAVARALTGYGRAVELGQLRGSALEAVIPHLVDAASRDASNEPRQAELCATTARALRSVGDLRGGAPWLRRALHIRERVLGPDHRETAQSLDDLACLLRDLGELAEALSLYERALAIREREHGAEHPETAESLNNLAILLHRQGQLEAARALYERVVAIHELTLGPEHPYTIQSLDSLGRLLREQGDLDSARLLLERALAVSERALGPDHPTTGITVHELSRLLREQGELDAARRLAERALCLSERLAGPEHPYTAFVIHNLAGVRQAQGDLDEAERLARRALEIHERKLGPDHFATAASVNRLAGVLRGKGDLAAARLLLERVLAIRELPRG